MLILFFCAVVAVALLFPQTAAGGLVTRLLVEAPARMLTGLTPARVAFIFLVTLATVLILVFVKAVGLIAIAQGLPDGLAWFAAFDVGAYLDAIALVWLLAATLRLRASWNALQVSTGRAGQRIWRHIALLRARLGHGSVRRSRRRGPGGSQSPKPDSDPWPALAISAG